MSGVLRGIERWLWVDGEYGGLLGATVGRATQPMLVVVGYAPSRAHVALWESNSAAHDDGVEMDCVGGTGGLCGS
jgi:hypothetical protein